MPTKHQPWTVPVEKMDTPTGLHKGTCSCGWSSKGFGSYSNAWKDATQHADKKNEQEE